MSFVLALPRYTLAVMVLLLFTTCKKDSIVPAYVHIEKFTLVGSTATYGSLSQKITDAWVYYEDGNLQGVYELPATFPIRNSGATKLRIIAGIKLNGVAATRVIYPFYNDTLMTANLVPGEIDTLAPQIAYFPDTRFAFGPVDFETGNPFTGAEYVTDPSLVFEGHTSVKITNTDTDTTDFAYTSGTGFPVPYQTSAAFLELNYKNDRPFIISLISSSGSALNTVTITPQANWSKIYINLTSGVHPNLTSAYGISVQVPKDSLKQKHNVYLDNIKVLYFQP